MNSAINNYQIGVVIPSYKEGKNICSLISELVALSFPIQIIVVDDSPDNESVDAIASMHLKNVQVIHRSLKGGRGSAVIDGIKYLLDKKCQFIVEMDADFSHPPAQISELLIKAISENIDLLIGSRYLPASRIENWPMSRRVFSKCSNSLARLLLGVPVRDYTNGYRVYSLSAAEMIVETCGKLGKGFISLSEILVNAYYRGYRVAETPTVFKNRVRGESSVNGAEISGALVGLLKIMKMKRKLLANGAKQCLGNS